MRPPSLRSRIRNGTLLMLAIALALGVLAIPTVYRLGGAIRETLYRNYASIEASQHMHAALYKVQMAQLNGTLAAVLAPGRETFTHWINVELNDITEVGEAEVASDIERRGNRIFDELSGGVHVPDNREYDELHQRIDELIAMNQRAMFRADSRSSQMSDRLAYEFAAGLFLLLLLGTAVAWPLASNLSRPLSELSDHLRGFSLRGPSVRLGEQPLAELQTVASEFNRMAERLEQFERLNVDRLIYEKGKTEAIIESLEDGIVLIDIDGIVTHMNEVAGIILGIEREDALGSSFDDLNSNSPHYVRIRSALAHATQNADDQRIEVDLHVRGRDHTYALKPVPLRQTDGGSFGTILIFQDITYLRDKDRARTNLIATLSHELNTPLTSLGFCVDLLLRKRELNSEQQELLTSIQEDLARMRHLASNLMELARGQTPAITVQSVPVDLAEMVQGVMKGFALQAEQKQIRLEANVEQPAPRIRADPLKLSWVVSNLIANALRYTPSGGTISISLSRMGNTVHLRIADTGVGIPPELRKHLFERFAQWTVNGSRPGAAGLGLAIAKEIVDAHGGRIFVDSESGQGTSFTVELPETPETRI
ncbi:MAG TPA: ATP-binding protein [Candidatus Binataceae bacterium]|nr:ATP-binding protein [Candidatus Binataceae bacterium]